MKLPVINETSYTKIKLPSGKEIGIKPWRVKEEKELLYATDSASEENAVNTQREIIKFIGRCTDDPTVFNSVSNADLLFTLMELRKLSKGSAIEYTYKCPHCGAKNEDEVSLRENTVVKPFSYDAIKLEGNIVITLKDVSYSVMDTLFSSSDHNLQKYNHDYLINSIDTVSVDGTLYTEFDLKDAEGFIDQLSSNQYDILRTGLENAISSVTLEKTFPCIRCSKDIEVNFGNLYDFFAF